jgi:ATP-dependent helicase/nuclease subunit A
MEILKARSYLDWLRLWLPQATRETDWQSDTTGAGDLFRWRLYAADEAYFQVAAPAPPSNQEPDRSPFDLTEVRRRIEWTYPFTDATSHVAKSSVSSLRPAGQDEEAAPLFSVRKLQKTPSKSAADARAIGNAHHRFQQFVALNEVTTIDALRAEAARLSEAGLLEAGDANLLCFEQLHEFWQSEVGRSIRQHAPHVRRELEFTARFTPAELAGLGLGTSGMDDDFVVVQGIVDVAVILPGEIWVLDFKTDDIAESEMAGRAGIHRPQLALYAQALERTFPERRVTNCWLHFLAIGRTIPVQH